MDHKSESACISITFNGLTCMAPQGTDVFIFAFTTETGQSVEHNRHRPFLFEVSYKRDDALKQFQTFTIWSFS